MFYNCPPQKNVAEYIRNGINYNDEADDCLCSSDFHNPPLIVKEKLLRTCSQQEIEINVSLCSFLH